MHITALQPQVKNADRINIFADGQFLLAASTLIVLQMGLKIGQELSAAQLAELRAAEAQQQALDRALNYLSFRPRSRQEVRNYLRGKNTPPELIDTVLERLDQMDMINDRAFASFWVETREQFNPKGVHALKNELRMKGIERSVVDEVVDEEQDEERALRAAHKKALSLLQQPSMDYMTFQRRLGPFLQRRGFGYEVTSRTVKQLWETLREEPAPDEDI
jgi:regulatory protein